MGGAQGAVVYSSPSKFFKREASFGRARGGGQRPGACVTQADKLMSPSSASLTHSTLPLEGERGGGLILSLSITFLSLLNALTIIALPPKVIEVIDFLGKFAGEVMDMWGERRKDNALAAAFRTFLP